MSKKTLSSCSACRSPLNPGKLRCSACGHWNFARITSPTKNLNGQSFDSDGSILMSNVTSAEIDRIVTGPWDEALGGGLVQGNIILLGGMPGAGKSTLIQQMTAAYLNKVPGEGMYIASEETLPVLRARGDRLKIGLQDRIRLVDAMTGVSDVGALLFHRKPCFILVDSINGIVGDSMGDAVELCKILKKYASTLNAPCIAVSHFTKDMDFAGLMALQHEVDALVTLDVDETTGIRTLEARKNRTGRTFIPALFHMSEYGLESYVPEESDDTNSEQGPMSHSGAER